MATNAGSLKAIKRVIKLIDRLVVTTDELKAWQRILSAHKGQQGRQIARQDERWRYDRKKKCVVYIS
jgi:hypothetical protein